jgi:hypothetical protein
VDLSKLTTGQKIALGAGVVLLIDLFLPWYSIDIGIASASANAFDAGFFAWFGSFLAIAAAVLIGLKVFQEGEGVSLGTLKTEQIALVLGGLGTFFILLRLITETDFLGFGIFLGLIAAGAITYGSFMAMKEAGLEMPSADDFKSMGGNGDSE